MKKLFRRVEKSISSLFSGRHLRRLVERNTEYHKQEAVRARQMQHANTFVRNGKTCFSQCDEDGLTLAIIERIGITDGTYCEFGVGNGLQNNTLILAALGWRGFWVGGEELAFDPDPHNSRFRFFKEWITAENIVSLHTNGLRALGAGAVDILSLDLDGNDIHFMRRLMEADIRPKVIIVEYNGKFPPPIRFEIDYDPNHVWGQGDYYGVSLQSYADLLEAYGYFCVCCNAGSGVNAFFVQSQYRDRFPEIPARLSDIYVEPFMGFPSHVGHALDLRTIERIFSSQNGGGQ